MADNKSLEPASAAAAASQAAAAAAAGSAGAAAAQPAGSKKKGKRNAALDLLQLNVGSSYTSVETGAVAARPVTGQRYRKHKKQQYTEQRQQTPTVEASAPAPAPAAEPKKTRAAPSRTASAAASGYAAASASRVKSEGDELKFSHRAPRTSKKSDADKVRIKAEDDDSHDLTEQQLKSFFGGDWLSGDDGEDQRPTILPLPAYGAEEDQKKVSLATLLQQAGISSDLFLCQLPRGLPILTSQLPKNKNLRITAQEDRPASIHELPAGKIGKLRVYRSGKVELQVGEGDVRYHVNLGSAPRYLQHAVCLSDSEESHAMSVLGDVTHKLVVTPRVDNLLDDL